MPRTFQKMVGAVRECVSVANEPNPYLAVLVADGDKIGATLAKLETLKKHREFSDALAAFAGQAETIVADHHGVLVYSGGDDVLAFLPVDKVLGCARELHAAFGKILAEPLKDTTLEVPTLSVGVAIGHFLEDLEELLDYGRAAERAAKAVPGKDALAVHLRKRGGTPVEIAARWDDKPHERLAKFAEWLNDKAIPNKLATDLHAIARVYDKWSGPSDTIVGDGLRVLAAKKARGAKDEVEKAQKEMRELVREHVKDADTLRRLANEILVARQIAVGLRQAEPKEGNT